MTFLKNYSDLIAGMDFLVVPTVLFQLLYVWFALDHGRRRILHCNVTRHPSAEWVIQQLRAAFPGDTPHRYLILDNDAVFSDEVASSIARLGLQSKRTAFRSPWQNGTLERFVGSVRRELLDHVVVLGEEHRRRLLREYIAYYNAERVHTSIGDAPAGRACEAKPSVLGPSQTAVNHASTCRLSAYRVARAGDSLISCTSPLHWQQNPRVEVAAACAEGVQQ